MRRGRLLLRILVAVAATAWAVGLLLAAYVLLWAPGVPLLPELNLYQQARPAHSLRTHRTLPQRAV